MIFGPLHDHVVLQLLLVAHFFHKRSHLVHGCLHLRHDAFLSVKGRLLASLDGLVEHLSLLVDPIPQIFLSLRPELHLTFNLLAQFVVHLGQHLRR